MFKRGLLLAGSLFFTNVFCVDLQPATWFQVFASKTVEEKFSDLIYALRTQDLQAATNILNAMNSLNIEEKTQIASLASRYKNPFEEAVSSANFDQALGLLQSKLADWAFMQAPSVPEPIMQTFISEPKRSVGGGIFRNSTSSPRASRPRTRVQR